MHQLKKLVAALALTLLLLGCTQAVLQPDDTNSGSGSSTDDGYQFCSLGKGLPLLYSCDQAFQGANTGTTVSLHGLPTPQEYIILLKNTTANGTADQICDNVRHCSALALHTGISACIALLQM